MRAFIGRLAHPEPGFDVNYATQSPDTDKAFFVPPTKVSFGPFRLLPTQLLLLQGEKPVPLGSRALEILIALLERRGELVSKQALMARVWPNPRIILKVDRHYLRGSEWRPMSAWKATLETAVGLFRFRRARGLRIAAVCAVVAAAAALDSILTAFALAPASA